jgi:hypothetical protein
MSRSREARKASNPMVNRPSAHIGRIPTFRVDEALSVPDGPLRNHIITYSYQCISEALAGVMGTNDLNWCTFASWASRTVGHVLDEQELPHVFEEPLEDSALATSVVGSILKAGRTLVFPQHRPALIAGNTAVFTDIARRFLDLIPFLTSPPNTAELASPRRADDDHNEQVFEEWLASFRPPEGRIELVSSLEHLRTAFRLYRRAVPLPPSVERSELIWVANCKVGEYEQLLVQPALQAAMFDPPQSGWLRGRVGKAAAESLTQLMAMYTPNRIVRCVDPIIVENVICRVQRSALQTPEAQAMAKAYPLMCTPRSPLKNWTDYRSRMRVIGEFFRVFHADGSFYESPFSYDDPVLDEEIRVALESAVRQFGVGVGSEDIARRAPGAQRLTREQQRRAESLTVIINAE